MQDAFVPHLLENGLLRFFRNVLADAEMRNQLGRYSDFNFQAVQFIAGFLENRQISIELVQHILDLAMPGICYHLLFFDDFAFQIIDNAIDLLSGFKEKAEPLRQIAVYIIERKK